MHNPFISQRSLIVEWGDCDPADIVFYPNYFRWFDASTAHHFKAAGLPKPELVKRYHVVGHPMVDTGAKFFAPSRYGDELLIETMISSIGTSSFNVQHRLFNNEQLCVSGHEKRVLVRRCEDGSLKAVPIPDDVRALFIQAG